MQSLPKRVKRLAYDFYIDDAENPLEDGTNNLPQHELQDLMKKPGHNAFWLKGNPVSNLAPIHAWNQD